MTKTKTTKKDMTTRPVDKAEGAAQAKTKKDAEAQRARWRAYYKANKDKYKKWNAAWRANQKSKAKSAKKSVRKEGQS